MRRAFSPIGVGLVLLAATACASEPSTAATPAPTATVDSSVALPDSTPETTVPLVVATADLVADTPPIDEASTITSSLDELSAGLTSAVDAVDYRLGVAVHHLDSGVTYSGGDTGSFALASVSKLALTVAVLERAEREQRELTWAELGQLQLMLSESKNEPAVALWEEFGAEGVTSALVAYSISGFEMPPDEQWGDMAASAEDVALVMSLFASDASPLSDDARHEVLSLLQSVVPEQRWGVSAGIDFSDAADTVLAIKNGWYPEDKVWRVNSAGAVAVSGQADYVVVVLSDGETNFSRAVRTVEEIAATVNAALYPRDLLVELPAFVFVPEELTVSSPGMNGIELEEDPSEALPAKESPPVQLVALGTHADVLVPAGDLLSSEVQEDSFAIWFEVAEDDVESLFETYLGSMRGLGWSTLSGPPPLLLSKQEGRFVAVTPLPGAAGGTQIVEFRIAPALDPTVGAAAVE